MFKIDKNVLLPGKKPSPGAPGKYPWARMKRGDSFFVPKRSACQVKFEAAYAANARATDGRKYTVRSVTEQGRRGWRVWRIQ